MNPCYSLSSVPELSPASAESKRTFWQRRVRDPIIAQLTQGITPEKIALTIAIGSAFALFPVLGTTTLLCFLAGFLLRLNQPIIQLINQAFWPIHVPAIFGCVRLGEWIFKAPHVHFSVRTMKDELWSSPAIFFHNFGVTVLHAVVAWVALAPIYIAAVYYIALPITRAIYRVKAEAAAKAALEAAARGPEHPVP